MEQEPSPEEPIALRQHLEKVHAAYVAFFTSVGHVHYVKMREIEVAGKQDDIIKMEPMDRATEIEGYKMRGDLRTTIEFTTLFEDTVAELKNRIQQLLEKEQPQAKQK